MVLGGIGGVPLAADDTLLLDEGLDTLGVFGFLCLCFFAGGGGGIGVVDTGEPLH